MPNLKANYFPKHLIKPLLIHAAKRNKHKLNNKHSKTSQKEIRL